LREKNIKGVIKRQEKAKRRFWKVRDCSEEEEKAASQGADSVLRDGEAVCGQARRVVKGNAERGDAEKR
jgi:hypothetical protein